MIATYCRAHCLLSPPWCRLPFLAFKCSACRLYVWLSHWIYFPIIICQQNIQKNLSKGQCRPYKFRHRYHMILLYPMPEFLACINPFLRPESDVFSYWHSVMCPPFPKTYQPNPFTLQKQRNILHGITKTNKYDTFLILHSIGFYKNNVLIA